MSQTQGTERSLSKAVAWATARDDPRAIAVVGSRARADHPADPCSDLDLIVMVRRLKRYLAGSHWLAEIETALGLFRWLAQETGARLGGSDPMPLEEKGMTWVRKQAAECEGGQRPGTP